MSDGIHRAVVSATDHVMTREDFAELAARNGGGSGLSTYCPVCKAPDRWATYVDIPRGQVILVCCGCSAGRVTLQLGSREPALEERRLVCTDCGVTIQTRESGRACSHPSTLHSWFNGRDSVAPERKSS